MILLIPVVFLAALALVVFFLVKAFRVAWRRDELWGGWRRVIAAAALVCAAVGTASYSLGAIGLMSTVFVAQDGGADSAPFPVDHPCRSKLRGAVGYDVQFLMLRTVCVMEDGERKAVEDVPQGVRMTAAASVACTAVLTGIAWTVRPRVSVKA